MQIDRVGNPNFTGFMVARAGGPDAIDIELAGDDMQRVIQVSDFDFCHWSCPFRAMMRLEYKPN
jgi:hypothetical protein